jgi:hypothetical protein
VQVFVKAGQKVTLGVDLIAIKAESVEEYFEIMVKDGDSQFF